MTDFRTLLRKDSPGVAQVHVSSAIGGQAPPKKRRDFNANLAYIPTDPVAPPTHGGTEENSEDEDVQKGSFNKIYSSTREMPKGVRNSKKIKGKKKLRQFMHVVNSELKAHPGDESRAFAGAWSTVQKGTVDKDMVHYEEHATGLDRCGTCVMFRSPDRCTLVEGAISAHGVCDRHARPSAPSPLYVKRPLLNGDALRQWALGQGFETTLDPSDMHVTILFCREPIDWGSLGDPCTWEETVPSLHGARPFPEPYLCFESVDRPVRTVEPLGPSGAMVLRFDHGAFKDRWRCLLDRGARSDHLDYKAHVTISYGKEPLVAVEPYTGPLVFGPEEWREADPDHVAGGYVEKKEQILTGKPIVGVGGRKVEPFDDGTYHIPFRYDPGALSYLNPRQVPWVLDAVTHPDDAQATVDAPLDQLVAIKGRVGGDTVMKHLDKLSDGDELDPPIVANINGADHILDGHDRLTAHWLNGSDVVPVRYTVIPFTDDHKPDPDADYDGSKFSLLKGVEGRSLVNYDDGSLSVPFRYDPAFFSHLRPDQLTKFLWAITHPDDVPDGTVNLDGLTAIQDRVNSDTVAEKVESGYTKLPVIVQMNGAQYVGDGHDRLTSDWLQGRDDVPVKLIDISLADNRMKPTESEARKSLEGCVVNVAKADPDKQQIFGWASVMTKGGELVTDKQGDQIEPEEIEKAAYEYVMHHREGGLMHEVMGVMKCIESCVFTKAKQEALGIDLGHEAWWIGFLVTDPAVWKAHKNGLLTEFSIGGTAVSRDV